MCRCESTKPGMTIIPDASITSASPTSSAGATVDDLVVFDQDVGGREVTHVRIEAEDGAAPDQHPPRRRDPEVGTRGIQVGDLRRRRRPGSRSPSAGPACSCA